MNISAIVDCYGCGVCAKVCPKEIISVRINKDGFYEPYLTEDISCTQCGLCVSVCSYQDNNLAVKKNTLVNSYAAWSKDKAIREKCSSGGVGFEVGQYLINQGYQVVGCRYNVKKKRAEHYVASTLEELIPSIGSKYIQSYTVDGLKLIDRKKKYLFIGMPCQIDSFRRYIQKFHCEDNFVLMDFFCHGVPTKLMWDKYVELAETKVGKLTFVSWRNKQNGCNDSLSMFTDSEENAEPVDWHDSYNMFIRGEKIYINSKLSQGDLFYKFFFSDLCLGKACYNKCKFKYCHSSADIRIGDFWGRKYKENAYGVNGVLALSARGNDILCSIPSLHIEESSLENVTAGQMFDSPSIPFCWRMVIDDLKKTNFELDKIYNKYYIILVIRKIKTLFLYSIKILNNRVHSPK